MPGGHGIFASSSTLERDKQLLQASSLIIKLIFFGHNVASKAMDLVL